MNGLAAIRLATLFSPAFPVGSFAWSQGLERAVADGLVHGADSLRNWLETLLRNGGARNDAILFAAGYRAESDAARMALALVGSAERCEESRRQGEALRAGATDWIGAGGEGEAAYPTELGRVAAAAGIALDSAIAAFLASWASNLVQAAIRLSVLGQTAGLRVLGALEPAIEATAAGAAVSTLDDLGGFAMIAEIASMNHETQTTRLFRS